MEVQPAQLSSLQDYESAMGEIISELKNEDLKTYESLSEFKEKFFDMFLTSLPGSVEVVKARKFFAPEKFIFWIILKVSEHFVYSFIVDVIFTKEEKSIKTYKKLEEIDELDLLSECKFKALQYFSDILDSQERFDYCVVSDGKIDRYLPQFEYFVHKVAPKHFFNTQHVKPRRNHEKLHKHKPNKNHLKSKTRNGKSLRNQRPKDNIRKKYRNIDRNRRIARKHGGNHNRGRKIRKFKKVPESKRDKKRIEDVDIVYSSSSSEDISSEGSIEQDKWSRIPVKKKD